MTGPDAGDAVVIAGIRGIEGLRPLLAFLALLPDESSHWAQRPVGMALCSNLRGHLIA
jgi:hypothetical protein